jgi:hypothetical protein
METSIISDRLIAQLPSSPKNIQKVPGVNHLIFSVPHQMFPSSSTLHLPKRGNTLDTTRTVLEGGNAGEGAGNMQATGK